MAPELEARKHYSKGFEFAKASQYENAIAQYTKAIEIDPDDVSAYLDRSTAFQKLGQLSLARKDVEKAYKLDRSRR